MWQDWDSIMWVNNRQRTYEYNANNNQTYSLWQDWDSTMWVNSSQSIAEYDTINNLTYSLWQDWDSTMWVNNRQYFLEYDANNNLTLELQQRWDSTIWVNNRQYIYEYDANNNQTLFLEQRWRDWTADPSWVTYWESFSEYDNNNNLVLYRYREYFVEGAPSGVYKYYYEPIVNTHHPKPLNFSFRVFPNPGSSYITIDLEAFAFQEGQVNIYSALGRQVYSQRFRAGETRKLVSLSDLSEGTYFIQVSIAERQKTQPLIIAR